MADGHAIRRITPDGQVTTVLGSVTQAGFQDDLTGTAGRLGIPCLNDPWGLVAGPDVLYIADQGNHAIRECRLPSLTLRTLAGDPDRPAIRWGLLRDGLEVFPEDGYATLQAPRGIAGDFRPHGEETLVVATGPCLAQIPGATQPAAARPRVELQPMGPLAAGEDYEVAFSVPNDLGGEAEGTGDFEYTVAFLDPDGTPAGPPAKGRGRFSTPLRIQGQPFTQPGHGRIQVRCVTAAGISGDAGRAVTVR